MSLPRLVGLLVTGLLVATLASAARADELAEGKALFEDRCSSCHTVGEGPSVGPDLKGVVQARERDWLRRMIRDPKGLIQSGDPAMAKLLKEYEGMEMPGFHLSDAETDALLAWLETAQGTPAGPEPAPSLSPSPPPLTGEAARGEALFKERCAACHTVGGGPAVGPDLKGVVQARERDWLRRMIRDPKALIQSGDPAIAKLVKEYRGMEMPGLNLSDAETDALLAWLETAQGTPAGPEPGPSPSPPPPTGDAARGEALFMGTVPLAGGGPACVACHNAPGAGPLGGGTLGVDLTDLHGRLGPERLASSLKGLPFPVMRNVYQGRALTTSEQADLAAWFARLSEEPRGEASAPVGARLWAAGLLGAGLLFGLLALPLMGWRPSISEELRRQA